MKILFLDDDEYRHELIRPFGIGEGKDIWHVHTVKEAISALKEIGFDYVSLDHDLGGRTFVDSSQEETGLDVAKFIATMLNPPKYIRIHSFNPGGAANMMRELAETALRKGVTVVYKPFNGKL